MVIPGTNGVTVSRQYLAVVLGMAGTIVAGSIWIGMKSKEIEINSGRISRLETFADEARQHDSNTTAVERDIIRRLDLIDRRASNGQRHDGTHPYYYPHDPSSRLLRG